MNRWRTTVRVGDVFHNDNMTLAEKGEVIATRFRAKFSSDDDLVNLIEELEDAAREDDVVYFDQVWDGVYDWADANRVWVDTLSH